MQWLDLDRVVHAGFEEARIAEDVYRETGRWSAREEVPSVLKAASGWWSDRLVGNDHMNVLVGRAGADLLIGMDGADMLRGGRGQDTLWGDGEDAATGEDGGADHLLGGLHKDTLYGGGNDDTLDGGSGRDELWGEAGRDLLRGGAHADTLYGGPGTDTLEGGGGDDLLVGGSDSDTLDGGAGADTFVLDFPESDTASGGPGDDVFLYQALGLHEIDGGPGHDVVDLTALDVGTLGERGLRDLVDGFDNIEAVLIDEVFFAESSYGRIDAPFVLTGTHAVTLEPVGSGQIRDIHLFGGLPFRLDEGAALTITIAPDYDPRLPGILREIRERGADGEIVTLHDVNRGAIDSTDPEVWKNTSWGTATYTVRAGETFSAATSDDGFRQDRSFFASERLDVSGVDVPDERINIFDLPRQTESHMHLNEGFRDWFKEDGTMASIEAWVEERVQGRFPSDSGSLGQIDYYFFETFWHPFRFSPGEPRIQTALDRLFHSEIAGIYDPGRSSLSDIYFPSLDPAADTGKTGGSSGRDIHHAYDGEITLSDLTGETPGLTIDFMA
jgi:hypothetical protein